MKPEALPLQQYDDGMRGSLDLEFARSGLGIWDSLCQSIYKRKEFAM